MKDPRLIEIYVRNYNRERERLAGDAAATRTRLEAKRDRIEGERQRNIDLVISYVSSEEDARQRIAELNGGRQRVEAERAALAEAPIPVALHPATLDRHVATVDALAERMAGHASADDDQGTLIDDFRALVHGVAVHPKGPREGFEIEVKGKLAALLGADVFPEAHYNSGSRVVAGGDSRVPPSPDRSLNDHPEEKKIRLRSLPLSAKPLLLDGSAIWKRCRLWRSHRQKSHMSGSAWSCLSAHQANSGLIAVYELNARTLQSAPDGRQIVDRRDPAAFFEVANCTLAQIGASSQFSLRPVEQTTSRPRLIGSHSTAISWEHGFRLTATKSVDIREYKR